MLSFSPTAETKIEWDQATIDAALRAGFDRAARDTAGNGILGTVLSAVLQTIVAQPLEWLLGR